MFATISKRLALSATGLLLTTGLIVQSQSSEWRARLCDWMPPAGAEVGHVAESPVSPCVAAEGRIVAYPGAEVVVGTEVAGLIVRLTVKEKSAVRAGDLITELNSADLRASRAEADARVAEAEADIRFYDREVRRDQALLAKHATTPQNLDVNVRGLELARARRDAALAGRDRLDALIAKTRITAPIDGVVTARHVQLGEIAEPGRAVVTIADLNQLRIEAEVDEFDVDALAELERSRLRQGDLDRQDTGVDRSAGVRWAGAAAHHGIGDLLDRAVPFRWAAPLRSDRDGRPEFHACGVELVDLGLDPELV